MIVGHKKQWDFLKNAYLSDLLAHAYLFSGPEQVGKKTLAIEFIKFINCQEKLLAKKPCHLCPSCRMIDRLAHPDLILLEAEETKKRIEIGQIRELINRLSLKPFLADYKVGLIDNAHLMNTQAQNCLLKTLEEPKGKTLLVLITDHREALLVTVLSRIQDIFFSPVPEKEIKNSLLGQGSKIQETDKILHFSFGKPGRAVEFLQQSTKLAKEDKAEKGLQDILGADLAARFDQAELLAKNYSPEVLQVWLRYLRDLLLQKIATGGETIKIRKNIKNLEKSLFSLNNLAVNKRLLLENLMLNLEI